MIMKILDIFRTGKAEAGEDPEALEAQETAAAAPEVLQAPAVEDLEAQDAAAAAPEELRGQGMEGPEAQNLETIVSELEEELEAQDAAAAAPETDRTKEEELEAWKEKMLRRLRGTSEKGY